MQGEFTALFSRKRPDHIHTVTNSHLEAAKYNHGLIRQTLSSSSGAVGGGGIGVLLKRRLSFPLAQIYPDGLQAPTGLYLSEIKYCWYSSDGSCSWGGWLAAGTAESIDMIGREGNLHNEQMLGNGINVKVYSLKECVPMWPFCYLTHFDW